MSNKTYVACQPGMKAAAEAAFAGLEIVVDDTLTTSPWEFRERPQTLEELMEAELEKEERTEADPKNALTFVVPVFHRRDDVGDVYETIPFLSIRVAKGTSGTAVRIIVENLKPTMTGDKYGDDYRVNVPATIGALSAQLKEAGIQVLSISSTEQLMYMKDV